MKTLITGAAGFIGANLAIRLVDEGHDVHAIVKPTSSPWRLDAVKDRIAVHIGDLNDEVAVADILRNVRPEVVYHFAVHGAYHHQNDDAVILRTAVQGTLNLLHASKAVDVRMFVNTGTSSEYGSKDHPMREDEIIDPNSYYAVGKAAQTMLCRQYSRQEELPLCTLRLFSAYGPYEEPGRLVPELIKNALANVEIPLAQPETARDFIYIDDIIDAYKKVAAHDELRGDIFNIGTGKQSTLREIAEHVLAMTGSSSALKWNAYPPRPFDTSVWVADVRRAADVLGIRAETTLEDGLRDMVQWVRTHADVYYV